MIDRIASKVSPGEALHHKKQLHTNDAFVIKPVLVQCSICMQSGVSTPSRFTGVAEMSQWGAAE